MLYVEILIAAAVAFLLGFLWYTALFGKIWQEETGITDEQARSGIGLTHGLAFLMMVVIAWGLSKWSYYHPAEDQNLLHGMFHGSMTGLKYALPAVAINYLYQKKSLKLFLIDGAYIVLVFAVTSGVQYALKLYEHVEPVAS